MHGRLELMWFVFHVIIWMCVVEVCVCCVGDGCCVVRVVFGFGVNPIMGWLHLMSSWTNWFGINGRVYWNCCCAIYSSWTICWLIYS